MRLWDTVTGEQKVTLTAEQGWNFNASVAGINSVAFSPDGVTLASGSSDNTVRLWAVGTWELKRTLAGHASAVLSVVFSPDGRTLASGSWDGTVLLWKVD